MWCIQGTQTFMLLSCTFNKDIEPLSARGAPVRHGTDTADTVCQPGDETLWTHGRYF